MTDQRKKTHRKNGNFRYLCPACNNPSIQPLTLPVVDFTCPNSNILVTAQEIREGLKLPNPYE